MNNRKLKMIEEFRFFDELHPAVREALQEANYEWNPVEIMSRQHYFYNTKQPLELLAAEIRNADRSKFYYAMKPKLNHEPRRRDSE